MNCRSQRTVVWRKYCWSEQRNHQIASGSGSDSRSLMKHMKVLAVILKAVLLIKESPCEQFQPSLHWAWLKFISEAISQTLRLLTWASCELSITQTHHHHQQDPRYHLVLLIGCYWLSVFDCSLHQGQFSSPARDNEIVTTLFAKRLVNAEIASLFDIKETWVKGNVSNVNQIGTHFLCEAVKPYQTQNTHVCTHTQTNMDAYR